ncbi:MAG: HEAT repeat domain-containing protein [Candidatus Lokiarchaeota archaeon]|nr:HEAT repeat domain-containing protein [Candidatus Lokiarchaeota archaeon]
MSKELKNLIDSVDSANQAQSDLETTIRYLKEEVQKLNFTIGEQKQIIQTQEAKLSSIQDDNIPEDISVLKDLVTQQRQDIIKKDKDIEILQHTISEITVELENVQNFEGENNELIYANKEIVQLTEENENFRLKVEELSNQLTHLQEEADFHIESPNEGNQDLFDAKKMIIKLTEENGINRVQIESSKQEIENLTIKNQDNLALKNQFLDELTGVNKIIDQLTFDNDQYHEKVNYLQQKLEETVNLQEDLPENESENSWNENIELKNLGNTNISIIENLKQKNSDMEKKFREEMNLGSQRISDLQEKVLEKDEELNSINLKLQKFERSNNQLSDLIVELKILQEQNEDNMEIKSHSNINSYGDLPPNLFFRMYKLLTENDRATIVNQLLDDLSNEIRDIRTYAIKILSVIRGERVFEILKELINDNDWIVKLYLIKAFRNFDEADTIPLLLKLQEDKDIDVREAAINALTELKLTPEDILPH